MGTIWDKPKFESDAFEHLAADARTLADLARDADNQKAADDLMAVADIIIDASPFHE